MSDSPLAKLIIYSFEDRNFSDSDKDLEKAGKKFSVPINPESFTKNFKVDVDIRRGHGSNGTEIRFKSTAPEELKLDFILDGTHTMEGYGGSDKSNPFFRKPVTEQLELFMGCVYKYEGKIHRPRFLMLLWGSEIRFRCVLTNLDVNHTLFNAQGEPLRVRLSATFMDYKTRAERIASDKPKSADLTHYRRVKHGERLDLLSSKIYNNPKYFLQVAKANALGSVRRIQPGSELYFPPFEKTE
jgi:hypothetical protein